MRRRLLLRIAMLLGALALCGLAFAVITVTPSPPPVPAPGKPYNVTLTAAGGDAPYTYVATDGHLPAGITLTTNGVLSGSATAVQPVNYTIVAADAQGREATIVAAAASTVTAQLASSTNTAVFGQAVMFTASVSGASPTGSVQFCADGTASDTPFCASGTLLCGAGTALANQSPALSVATCTATTLAVGSHMINARYGGDVNNAQPPDTNIATLAVGKAATITAISAPASSSINQAISITSTVAVAAPGGGTPTGSITVSDGATSCVIVLPATSCTLTPAGSGSKTLTASYSGNTNFVASTATAPLFVGLLPATLTLISSQNPSQPGETVMFTATVSQAAAPTGLAKALAAAVPTGSVVFTRGTSTLGTVALSPAGQASVSTSALAPGPNTIVATYSGDATTAAATASLVQQVDTGSIVPARMGSREWLALLALLLVVCGAAVSRRRKPQG